MKIANQDHEGFTAELFPKIHSKTTSRDLQKIKDKIHYIINAYLGKHGKESAEIFNRSSILEVGCGGRASGIISLESYKPQYITAVDLSDKNLENTLNICHEYGFKNVKVMKGNALRLDFLDNSFDFVFSNGVIHHTEDPRKCFLEMTRVLKPGGFLFLGIYGYGGIFGKLVHPVLRAIGRILPVSAMENFTNKTGIFRSSNNSILDICYTPIQKTFYYSEISEWFKDSGYSYITREISPKWFYRAGIISKILFGDGYIYVMARKN
jgi:ubiquinone/menaquinone biosynthesis C-methylase UbiE